MIKPRITRIYHELTRILIILFLVRLFELIREIRGYFFSYLNTT
jgi:hypothetical protein